MNGPVYAIAVSGSNVYIGGGFTTINGSTMTHIAKYNGSTWSALGFGAVDTVRAIATFGSYLYAGGDFNTAGGVSAHHIARYDTGSGQWSALTGEDGTNGVDGPIYAIAVASTGRIYVGGD